MSQKVKISEFKFRLYNLVADNIESHLEIGWNHAHKYQQRPSKEYIIGCFSDEIMLGLTEIIDFED